MRQYFIAALLVFGLFSCIKKEDGYPDNGGNVDTNGEWVVNIYQRNQSIATNTYNGYLLRFNASGDLLASKNGFSSVGRWRKMNDTFRIENFTNAPFAQLNKDWKINYINLYEIDLKFLDLGDTSYLQFRKL